MAQERTIGIYLRRVALKKRILLPEIEPFE
jgi:hypothetical protein